jgi:hypothetical protein
LGGGYWEGEGDLRWVEGLGEAEANFLAAKGLEIRSRPGFNADSA